MRAILSSLSVRQRVWLGYLVVGVILGTIFLTFHDKDEKNSPMMAEKQPSDVSPAPHATGRNITSVPGSELPGGLPPTEMVEEAEAEPLIITESVRVKRGDNLNDLLEPHGVTAVELQAIVKAAKPIENIARLDVGQLIELRFGSGEIEEKGQLQALVLDYEEHQLVVERVSDKAFEAREEFKELETRLVKKAGTIDRSLYHLAKAESIPNMVMHDAVSILSYDIDFNRDIKRGQQFSIVYEEKYNSAGKRVKFGDILYAAVQMGGREVKFYRFEEEDGSVDYYTQDGKTMRQPLMRIPIEGARKSSSFGYRIHPIHKVRKMHKGTDWAAPTGTPIYAAGDGRVEFIGRRGGYGNYIRIHHNGDFKTAYAHISRYAKGMRKGKRVKQGQVIAYVGSTGGSTGPHLHFEIIHKGKHVDPMKVKMPPSKQLKGKTLKAFKKEVTRIDTMVTGSMNNMVVAQKG